MRETNAMQKDACHRVFETVRMIFSHNHPFGFLQDLTPLRSVSLPHPVLRDDAMRGGWTSYTNMYPVLRECSVAKFPSKSSQISFRNEFIHQSNNWWIPIKKFPIFFPNLPRNDIQIFFAFWMTRCIMHGMLPASGCNADHVIHPKLSFGHL